MKRSSVIVRLALAVVVIAAVAVTAGSAKPSVPQGRVVNAVAPFAKAALGDRSGPEKMDEVLARDRWFYGPRMAPGTRLPQDARIAAAGEANAIAASQASIQSNGWTALGPAPIDTANLTYNDPVNGTPPLGFHDVSGRLSTVAVHPTKPNTVYVGAADGGIWRTTNGGGSWTSLGDNLPTQAMGSIAIDPANPLTVFAGTGEASTNSDGYFGAGIFRATDGVTFTKVGGTQFDKGTVFKILIKGTRIFAATNKGLWRSTNNGNTWSRVLNPGGGDRSGNFITDVIDTGGNTLLTVSGWRLGSPWNGLYRSTNNGGAWSLISPPGFVPQANIGRVSLATTVPPSNTIYAVVQDAQCILGDPTTCNAVNPGSTLLNGIYKTTTGATGTWSKVADSVTFSSDPNSALSPAKIGAGYEPGVQAWYNQYVVVDPTHPNHVVVGLEEIYDSQNGGTNWHTIGRYWNFCISNVPPNCNLNPNTHRTTHPDQHGAAFGIKANGHPLMYAGNDGGVWRQEGPVFDNDHWQDLNTNLNTAQFYYADISGDGTIYGGLQDNGQVKYIGGLTWPTLQSGDGGDSAVEPSNANHSYWEYVYLIMGKTSDGGQTFTDISTPDSGSPATARFIAPYDMDPLNPNHIVALGESVWESTAGIATTSSSWVSSYDQGAGHVGTALAVRGSTIYTGWCGPCNPTPNPLDPNGGGFARGMSSNVGGTWHVLTASGLPNRYITSVTVDPGNLSHIFVTLSGFSRRWVPAAGVGHVFESTNGGASFTDISNNLPDAPANDTALYSGRLFAATDVGVFERLNNGSWVVAGGSGLPAVSVLDLALQPGSNVLIATTHGRGVYKTTL